MKKPIVLDLEYTDNAILLVGYATEVYRYDICPGYVWDSIADPDRPKICHTKADYNRLLKAGHAVEGPLYDTQQMAWLWDENTPLSLDYLVKYHLGSDPDKRIKQVVGKPEFVMDDGTRIPLEWFESPDDLLHVEGGPGEKAWTEFIDYCQRDLQYTKPLYERLRGLLAKTALRPGYTLEDYWLEWEVLYARLLVDMECAGLPINLTDAAALAVDLKSQVEEEEKKVLDTLNYKVNLNSAPQLSEVLYSKVWQQGDRIEHGQDLRKPALVAAQAEYRGKPKSHVTDEDVEERKAARVRGATPPGFEVTKVTNRFLQGYWTRKGRGLKKPPRTKTATATDTKVLMRHFYEDEFVLNLLRYRKVTKALQYVEAYPEYTRDGRMYGCFNRTGTVTGRLSSSNPNMMNVPSKGPIGKSIRGLFQGDLIVGDHSQLEVRILAHLSQDPALMRIFQEGRDIYCETGTAVFGKPVEEGMRERDIAKVVVLGTQYGAQEDTLAGQLTIAGYPTTPDVARGYLYELSILYKRAEEFKGEVAEFCRRTGFVKTLGGRLRRIPQGARPGWKSGFTREDRQAVNSVIQGSAADILHRNMLATWSEFPRITLLAQVHDELVWEHPRTYPPTNLSDLKKVCENPGFSLSVPLKFDPAFCRSWKDK